MLTSGFLINFINYIGERSEMQFGIVPHGIAVLPG